MTAKIALRPARLPRHDCPVAESCGGNPAERGSGQTADAQRGKPLVLLVLIGPSGVCFLVTIATYLARHTPDALLGRVRSAYGMVQAAATPAGMLGGAVLGQRLGIATTADLAALCVALSAAAALLVPPTITVDGLDAGKPPWRLLKAHQPIAVTCEALAAPLNRDRTTCSFESDCRRSAMIPGHFTVFFGRLFHRLRQRLLG
ncbi:MAG: hypothetical protein ACJ736_04175 [Streptomyces sp.]